MLRELLSSLRDSLECGDLVGHLCAFWRVATHQVQPEDPAGSPAERRDTPAEVCGAAQPGTGHPRVFPPSSSPDRLPDRGPSIVAVTPLDIVPSERSFHTCYGEEITPAL